MLRTVSGLLVAYGRNVMWGENNFKYLAYSKKKKGGDDWLRQVKCMEGLERKGEFQSFSAGASQ